MSGPVVVLRPIQLADWSAVHSWASRPEACRYQTWGPNSEEETRAFVRSAVKAWAEEPRRRHPYVALVDGEVLGSGDVQVRDQSQRQGEISYLVNPRVWGRGVGMAIGVQLLRIGFEELGFHRIVGTCDPRNLASARVLTKLGMTYEGRLRHTQLIRDGWRDSDTYSILEDEWRAGR